MLSLGSTWISTFNVWVDIQLSEAAKLMTLTMLNN